MSSPCLRDVLPPSRSQPGPWSKTTEGRDETHLSLSPGSVDDQVPSEDGRGSAIGSEEDVASIMDELFNMEHLSVWILSIYKKWD
jgi:hypothetical protein